MRTVCGRCVATLAATALACGPRPDHGVIIGRTYQIDRAKMDSGSSWNPALLRAVGPKHFPACASELAVVRLMQAARRDDQGEMRKMLMAPPSRSADGPTHFRALTAQDVCVTVTSWTQLTVAIVGVEAHGGTLPVYPFGNPLWVHRDLVGPQVPQ